MKRFSLLILAFALAASSCSDPSPDGGEPPTTPEVSLDPAAVSRSALRSDDVGKKWVEDKNVAPSTIQVGGEVGPANIDPSQAEKTSTFNEKDGIAYLTNSVFLLEGTELAEEWILQHEEADATEKWTQERKDGGSALFRRTGRVKNLPALGDENYSAAISVEITDAEGVKTKSDIEYVVYRIGRVLGFVITQDASAGIYARRQEQKVARLAQ